MVTVGVVRLNVLLVVDILTGELQAEGDGGG